jgi:phage gp36-like protein
MYITLSDLEDRITETVVRQILDDNVDGTPDANPLARVIEDAESYVEGFLRGNYSLTTLRALGTSAPNEVKRLCLDIAVAHLYDRHPEYIRADGMKLMERARRDLIDLRKGVTRLDVVGSPEPAANEGGVMLSGDPEDPTPVPPKFFNNPDSFGIY